MHGSTDLSGSVSARRGLHRRDQARGRARAVGPARRLTGAVNHRQASGSAGRARLTCRTGLVPEGRGQRQPAGRCADRTAKGERGTPAADASHRDFERAVAANALACPGPVPAASARLLVARRHERWRGDERQRLCRHSSVQPRRRFASNSAIRTAPLLRPS